MRRAQSEHVRVHHLAQARLDSGGRAVGDHGSGIVKNAPETDRERHGGDRSDQCRQRNPSQHTPEEPAQEGEARDPGRHRQETQEDGREDAGPDPGGESPELPV